MAGATTGGACSTTFLAGGGIRGGAVHGASDKHGAFPQSDPVDPVDVQATMYECLGLGDELHMEDQLHRVWPVSTGQVIRRLLR